MTWAACFCASGVLAVPSRIAWENPWTEVSGVLSSWETFATNSRWDFCETCNAAVHIIERQCQFLDLLWAVWLYRHALRRRHLPGGDHHLLESDSPIQRANQNATNREMINARSAAPRIGTINSSLRTVIRGTAGRGTATNNHWPLFKCWMMYSQNWPCWSRNTEETRKRGSSGMLREPSCVAIESATTWRFLLKMTIRTSEV